jgi:hypothetical protein
VFAAAVLLVLLQGCGGTSEPAVVTAPPPPAAAVEAAAPVDVPEEEVTAPDDAAVGTSEVLRPDEDGDGLFALVFGNGAYRHGDALTAPAKDAALMARALRSRGYHVLLSLDRDFAGMQHDLQAFDEMSQGAQVRVLYFAGHGFEFDNANYLLPVDSPANVGELSRLDVRINALRLDMLTWELEKGAETLIAIIDACRVLPSRGAVNGLTMTAEKAPQGTIIAYATSPGQVAMDSLRSYGVAEDHSPYTYFLANALVSDENDIWDQALLSTSNIVIQQTGGEQKPWMNAQVNAFPRIGQDLRQAPTSKTGSINVMDWGVSPSRSAAGKFWARETIAAEQMQRNGNLTDADLMALAKEGDSRAAVALSSRWWEAEARQGELIKLLEPAAERGHAMAQTNLGTHLWRSRAKDSKRRTASYWWQLASAQGVGEARSKLAMSDPSNPDNAEEFARGLGEMLDGFQFEMAPAASDGPEGDD